MGHIEKYERRTGQICLCGSVSMEILSHCNRVAYRCAGHHDSDLERDGKRTSDQRGQRDSGKYKHGNHLFVLYELSESIRTIELL